MALSNDGPLLIPFVLPDEEVFVETVSPKRAVLKSILKKSTDRSQPPCIYFGQCGGCQLQHMNQESYKTFKKDQVIRAFQKFNLPLTVLGDMEILREGERRRINFRAEKNNGEIDLGFHKRRSHDILNIETCLLLKDSLNQLIDPLRVCLNGFLNTDDKVHIFLTDVDDGVDFLMVVETGELSQAKKTFLVEWGKKHGMVRMILQTGKEEELLYQKSTPHVSFGQHSIMFPSQGFLQPSRRGQEEMIGWIIKTIPKKVKRVADLFCGLGTFSFPLSDHALVMGYEAHPKAVQYFNLSANQLKTKHTIEATQRDLFLYPLSFQELNQFDMVLLDPPRAGAYQQVRRIAKSDVPYVIMVSCNVDTFARDASILRDGGYQIKKVHLLDQFLWSPHLEIISFFEKS